ncbi:MAG: hypothetical protein AAF570_18295, partial [Bacteroidota bacterium]
MMTIYNFMPRWLRSRGYLLALICLLIAPGLQAQNMSLPQFEVHLGPVFSNIEIYDIAYDSTDQTYLVLGSNSGFVILVHRLRADGTIIWSKQYESIVSLRPSSIHILQNGDFAVLGVNGGTSVTGYLIRCARDGTKLFGQRIVTNIQPLSLLRPYGMVEQSNGGLLVMSMVRTAGNLTGDDLMVQRFLPDLTPDWTRMYGTGLDDNLHAVIPDGNDGLYFAGNTQLVGNNYYPTIGQLDAQGNIVWLQRFTNLNFAAFTSLARGPSGKLYAAGWTGTVFVNHDFLLVGMEDDGSQVHFAYSYPHPNGNYPKLPTTTLRYGADDRLYMGDPDTTLGPKAYLLTRLDTFGIPIQTERIDLYPSANDEPSDFELAGTADERILFVGTDSASVQFGGAAFTVPKGFVASWDTTFPGCVSMPIAPLTAVAAPSSINPYTLNTLALPSLTYQPQNFDFAFGSASSLVCPVCPFAIPFDTLYSQNLNPQNPTILVPVMAIDSADTAISI